MFWFRFVSRLFPLRFFGPMFLTLVVLTRPIVSAGFRTPVPLLLVAWRLDAAEGAPEIFDLPFIANFLFFRYLNQLQDMLHLFEGFFEGFHDLAHLIHSPGERRRRVLCVLFVTRLFVAGSFNDWWRSVSGFWFRLGAGNGRGFHAAFFMRTFFRRRRGLAGGGRRSGTGGRGGMSRTQAASTAATATSSATG